MMAMLPRSLAHRQATLNRSMLTGGAGGRTAIVSPEPRPLVTPPFAPKVSEVIPVSGYGDVTLTPAGDTPTWIVGQGGGNGGFIDSATLFLATPGSTSTVLTVYVMGVSIGTVTFASTDTTAQTDALTAIRVEVGDRVQARVTTAGTGAKGLSGFIPING